MLDLDLPLATVLGTFGVERHAITFPGQAAHSGSTPMNRRKDALLAAAKISPEIYRIAERSGGGVCTIGSCTTKTGIVTSVVEECRITLDQRHLDAAALAQMLQEAKQASERFAEEGSVAVSWERLWRIEPVLFNSDLVSLAETSISETDAKPHRMPSGPLHDAAEVARAGAHSDDVRAKPARHQSLQPGNARAYGGSTAESVRAFFAAIAPYDPGMDPAWIKQWSEKLAADFDCAKEANASQTLVEIEAWLNGPVAANIVRARPAVHVAALRLIPAMLRNRLQLCQEWTADQRSMITYQRVRDRLNAQLVLDELKAFPGPPKLILWAHHSHLHYNSLGQTIPSMGQYLHDALHNGMYSIGLFAEGGSAIDTATIDQAHGLRFLFALAPKPIPHGPRWSVEEQLSQQSPRDFFLDLRHASKGWAAAGTSRLENNGRMPTALSADFDGAILLHRVSGSELDFLPGWLRASARTIGFVIARPIISAALVVTLLAGLIYLLRRRRSPSG